MKPAARIVLNGRDVTAKWASVLVSLTVTDEAGVKSDTVEIELDNREGFAAPPINAEVQIWLGYEPRPKYIGRFKVDSWTKRGPTRTMTISAKAAELTSEIKATKTRSHHDTTLGAIVKKIAGEHGLVPVIDGPLAARAVPHIDQQTESDMGFLSRLARRNGATFKLADGKVIFTAKGSKKLPSGGNKPRVAIRTSQLSTWEARSEERGGHKSVKCAYMDHAKGERVYVEAGGGKPCHRDKRLYGSKAEAQAAADATLGDLTRGKVTVDIDGPGNPDLFAEALVAIDVGDPEVNGEYLAKSVTHTFSASGYTTSASLETEGSDATEADPPGDDA